MTLEDAIEKLWKETVDDRAYDETLPDLLPRYTTEKITLPAVIDGCTTETVLWEILEKKAQLLYREALALVDTQKEKALKLSPYIYIKE